MPQLQDASVGVARTKDGRVAVLSSRSAEHGEIFNPGGRRDPGMTLEDCARRELKEEAGVEATRWQRLGPYAITLGNNARLSLFLA